MKDIEKQIPQCHYLSVVKCLVEDRSLTSVVCFEHMIALDLVQVVFEKLTCLTLMILQICQHHLGIPYHLQSDHHNGPTDCLFEVCTAHQHEPRPGS